MSKPLANFPDLMGFLAHRSLILNHTNSPTHVIYMLHTDSHNSPIHADKCQYKSLYLIYIPYRGSHIGPIYTHMCAI